MTEHIFKFGKNYLFQVALSISLSGLTIAQDGHYLSEQYGNRSMLLSGAVIGSVEDLGAVFYNPGKLAMIENPAFVITAQVYQLNTLKIEDGLGNGKDLSESKFGGAPSLVAGTFKLKFLPEHHFAYSFLTRYSYDLNLFIRTEEQGEIIEALPGEEEFSGNVSVTRNLNEDWAGLTWSHKLGSKASVGITNFVTTRNQSASNEMQLQALSAANQVAMMVRDRNFSYNTYGLVWKLGLAFDLSPVTAGITLTTPNITLSGNGSFLYQDFLTGIDTTGNGITDDIYVSNIQDDLDAVYKSPLSVGVGLGIPLGKKILLHLSSEWFNSVSKYTILESEPFEAQSSGEIVTTRLVADLNSVINYGFGLEMSLNEKTSLYGSFATDFSAVKSDFTRFIELTNETNNATIQADIYNFGGGFVLESKWGELTLGVTYGFANQNVKRVVDLPDDGDDEILDSGESNVKFGRWRFLIGFSFPFTSDLKDKIDDQ